MYNDITGIILAGGKSTRMGQNKSFLRIGSKSVIEHVSDLMKSLFQDVIIITNEPEKYQSLELKCFEDIIKGIGPLGGIHSGLTNSLNELNFVISCDIPFISKEVIDFIISQKENNDIVVTKADGFIQQLCGLYRKRLLPEIDKMISNSIENETRDSNQFKRKCRVLSLIDKVDAKIIDIEKEFSDYKTGTFFNMNKPEDYLKALKMI